LAQSKRDRSEAILEDVAARFGMYVGRYANGSSGTTASPSNPAQVAGAQSRARAGGLTQFVTVNYPVAEPISTATNKAMQYAAALGGN
jgi:hypothetical protein